MEDKRRARLHDLATLISKTWRGFSQWRRVSRMRGGDTHTHTHTTHMHTKYTHTHTRHTHTHTHTPHTHTHHTHHTHTHTTHTHTDTLARTHTHISLQYQTMKSSQIVIAAWYRRYCVSPSHTHTHTHTHANILVPYLHLTKCRFKNGT